MRIFLDTEYTNPNDCELISIGMVSEDGQHRIYLERSDFPSAQCNAFVIANVLPQLRMQESFAMDLSALGDELVKWFARLPRKLQIAADSRIDMSLLKQAVGGLPNNVSEELYDLRPLIDTPVYHSAVEEFYRKHRVDRHHALQDADAHRAGFLAWARRPPAISSGPILSSGLM